MKIIRELQEEILSEAILDEATGKKRWTISGITLQSDVQNRNKRTYPKSVLDEAIKLHTDKFMTAGRALGELNHPDQNVSSINLDRVSHKFISVTEDGTDYITKAEVLDTPTGMIVQNLLEGDVKLGISSRGLGNIKQQDNKAIVENFHLISLGDIVSDPSGPNCFINGILESVEFQLNKEGVIEQVEIEETMDEYSKILQNSSKSDISTAINSIFNDYLGKIKR